MADEKNDGVVFEIHADDSSLEGEMNRAAQKVKKSAEQTAQAQEKVQKKASEAAKQSGSEQVSHYENAQEKIRRKASDTGDKIVKKHGQDTDKLKQHETEHENASKQSDENRRKHHSDTGDKVVKKHGQDAEQLKKHAEEYEAKAKQTAANVGKAYAAIGTAAVTASVTAITEAAKMETSFAKVKTLLSDKAIVDNYYAEMKAAAKDTGLLFSDLSESVYSAISASVDENKAVDFSKTAVKLAKGGFTSSATSVDVLTTAINAYGLAAEDAAHISNVLITAQNAGKTTVDELAGSMGQTIPIAKSAGAAVEDLATQYAILTKNGIATSEAGTGIKAMLSELSAAGTGVSDTLKDLTGKSFSELQAEGKSTADILNILNDYAMSSGKSLSDLFGSVEAGSAALTLVKDGGADFNKILAQMKGSAGATEKAYETMSNTLEERFKKLKNKFVLAFSEVGEELMPYAEELVSYIDDNAEEIAGTIKEIGNAAGELTKILGEGVKMLWEHKEAVLAAAAAYAAYKTAVAVSSVVKSATAAIKGLNIALAANPAGVVAAGIALLVTALAGLKNAAAEAEAAANEYANSLAEINRSADATVEKTDRELEALQRKIDRYDELRLSAERTAAEEAELQDIANELQSIFGDNVSVVNGLTGEYNDLTSAVENYARALQAQAAVEAEKKRLEDLYALKSEIEEKKSSLNYETPFQTGFTPIDEFLSNKALEDYNAKCDEYNRQIEDVEKQIEQSVKNIEEQTGDYYETVAGTAEKTAAAFDGSTAAIFRQTEAARENAEAAAAQKVSLDELAKSTESIIKSAEGLYAILEKVKNGEALTYDEIQRLIAVYPDLAGNISITADGYTVEKSAIDGLNAALNDSIQTQLDAEREKTLAAIDGARERIKIYQREAEAIAKTGASADQKRLAELAAAIGEEEKYIDSLAAKLKTDDSAGQYLQNGTNSSAGTGNTSGGSGSDTDSEYAEKRAELDYRKNMGEIDDDEYYKQLEDLRDEYLEKDSAEWRAVNVAIKNYKDSKKKQPDDPYTKELDALDYRHDMDEIDDDEYWNEFAGLRDKYLEKDSDEWRAANVKLHNYEKSKEKSTASPAASSNSSGGNIISIDSYIPTIWDDPKTAGIKRMAGLGAAFGLTGNGANKKIDSGLETIEAPRASVSVSAPDSAITEAQALAEAARALKSLEKADEKRKISLFLELKARDLMIGTAAYEDINDITKMNGKSPLIR